MSESVLLYVTAANRTEAGEISRALVESGLVACANIMQPHTAVYRWEGEVKSDKEVAIIMKTRRELVIHASERIKAMHSYDVPCVVAVPIVVGNPEFLQWIDSETAE